MNEATVLRLHQKKQSNLARKYSQICISFQLSAIRMSAKCFANKSLAGDKPTLHEIVSKRIHLRKQLRELYAKTIILFSDGHGRNKVQKVVGKLWIAGC